MMDFEPDWNYLGDYLVGLHHQILEDLEANRLDSAERLLEECEEIVRQLELWRRTRTD